jgi:hypothetical protein
MSISFPDNTPWEEVWNKFPQPSLSKAQSMLLAVVWNEKLVENRVQVLGFAGAVMNIWIHRTLAAVVLLWPLTLVHAIRCLTQQFLDSFGLLAFDENSNIWAPQPIKRHKTRLIRLISTWQRSVLMYEYKKYFLYYALVRERTVPTKLLPLVDEVSDNFCG